MGHVDRVGSNAIDRGSDLSESLVAVCFIGH